MRRYNYIFDGTLKAGHDFTYKYDPKDPFRLLSVDAKEYRSSTEEVDTTRREHSYAFDGNGNLVLQLSDLAERIDSASFADTAAMQVRQYLWDEDNHLLAINDNGFVSNYFYDAAGERTVKISAPDLAVYVNGTEALKNDSALVKFVGYVSPYLVVSNGGRYTKHIYAGTQRIASKLGDIESFGADPRRVEYAGANLKEVDFGTKYEQQTKALLVRYDSLGVMNKPRELNDYVGGQSFCCSNEELPSYESAPDGLNYESLIFFYHPDHLGSTALVTDNDGNVVQSIAYIPYGEVFIEERNGTWNTPYLFNGKELDEETGLYYYGARYLNPTNGMWLSTDPLFEKYVGMSPYNYCVGNPVKLVDPDGRAPWWENQNIRHAKKHAENTGGKYIERENKNGFIDASVQDVYTEGQDVVVELTVYKGTARNDKNVVYNTAQAFEESSFGSLFAEGSFDGANQGSFGGLRELSAMFHKLGDLSELISDGADAVAAFCAVTGLLAPVAPVAKTVGTTAGYTADGLHAVGDLMNKDIYDALVQGVGDYAGKKLGDKFKVFDKNPKIIGEIVTDKFVDHTVDKAKQLND